MRSLFLIQAVPVVIGSRFICLVSISSEYFASIQNGIGIVCLIATETVPTSAQIKVQLMITSNLQMAQHLSRLTVIVNTMGHHLNH